MGPPVALLHSQTAPHLLPQRRLPFGDPVQPARCTLVQDHVAVLEHVVLILIGVFNLVWVVWHAYSATLRAAMATAPGSRAMRC